MLCTDELNAKLLCRQHEEAIANLTAENEKYDKIKAAIMQFVEDPTIDSCGIRSLKRQLEDYILIIDAIKSANDIDIQEYTQANAFIGDEYLFGRSVTLREQRRQLKKISDGQAAHYRSLYNASRYSLTGADEYYREMAERYENESALHQSIIDECTRIIDKYDGIENSTYAMLQQASQYRGLIIDALLTMGQAFDGENYNSYISDYWRESLSIETALNLDGVMEELIELEVTDEQISNMKEKGYSPAETLAIVKKCTTEKDRTFLNALMGKKYEEAFMINPKELSDDMFEILSDYYIHMYHFDSRNQCTMSDQNFKEIEDFSHALLSAYDPLERVGDTFNTFEMPTSFVYLGRMVTCTNFKLYNTTDAASNTVCGSDDHKQKMADHYRTRAAYYTLEAEAELRFVYQFNQGMGGLRSPLDVSIFELDFGTDPQNPKDFSFTIEHSTPNGNSFKDRIKGINYNSPSDLTDGAVLLKEKMFSKSIEEAKSNVYREVVKNASLTVLSVKYPLLASALSTADMFLNGSGGITGLDKTIKPAFSKLGKQGASYASATVSSITNTVLAEIMGLRQLKKASEDMNTEDYINEFAIASSISVCSDSECLEQGTEWVTTCGIFDPGIVYMRNRIESNGSDWADFGKNEDGSKCTPADVLEAIRNDEFNNCKPELVPRVLEMCDFLLNGAPQDNSATFEKGEYFWDELTGHDGKLDGNDMEVYHEAVRQIDTHIHSETTFKDQLYEKAMEFDNGTLVED